MRTLYRIVHPAFHSPIMGLALASIVLFVGLSMTAHRPRPRGNNADAMSSTFRATDLIVDNTSHLDGLVTFGGGLTGFPTTTCPAGQAEVATATDGTSTCAAFGSSSLTNSAGVNVVTKSDGTNLVATGIVDDGTTVGIPSEEILIGGGSPFSAGTLYTINGTSPTVTTDLAIVEADTHTAYETIQELIWNQTGSYDTTLQASTYWGLDVEVQPTHSAGANPLALAAIHCSGKILTPVGLITPTASTALRVAARYTCPTVRPLVRPMSPACRSTGQRHLPVLLTCRMRRV